MRVAIPNLFGRLDANWRHALRAPLVIALITALLIQLVIALLAASDRGMTPAAADEPLLDIEPAQVTAIRIGGIDGEVRLTRAGSGWILPGLDGFPADAGRVANLLDTLVALQRPLPIATSKEARQRFKVTGEDFERRLTLIGDGGELATLLAGTSPGFRRSYVRVGGEEAIYDLPLAAFELSVDADQWIDDERLQLESDAIRRISTARWSLIRDGERWQLQGAEGEPDQDEIDALVRQVASLGYQGVFGTEPPSGADLEAPVLTLDIELSDGGSRSYRIAPLQNEGADSDDHVLKPASDPYYYRVADYELDGLLDRDAASVVIQPAAPPKGEAQAEAPRTEEQAGEETDVSRPSAASDAAPDAPVAAQQAPNGSETPAAPGQPAAPAEQVPAPPEPLDGGQVDAVPPAEGPAGPADPTPDDAAPLPVPSDGSEPGSVQPQVPAEPAPQPAQPQPAQPEPPAQRPAAPDYPQPWGPRQPPVNRPPWAPQGPPPGWR